MYILSDDKRDEMREPLGELISGDDIPKKEMNGMVVAVGDMVTATLIKQGIEPDISVVDYRTGRKNSDDETKSIIRSIGGKVVNVSNPPGEITDEMWNAIERSYESGGKVRIEVDGEEDLAALPAICLAPDGTAVLYGLPSQGIVFVKVSDYERNKVLSFLKKMEE